MNRRNMPVTSLMLRVLGAVTIAFSLAILALMDVWRPTFVAESVWYLVLLWVFSSIPPFRLMVAKLPRLYQLALLGFGLALLSAQFLGGGRHTYPVVRWAMFNDPVFQPKAVIYEGISASGNRVLLRPTELVPSLRYGRFTSKLRHAYESAEEAPLPEGTTEFDQLLRSLALIHNRSAEGDPIVAVEAFEYSVPTSSYFDRSEHRRKLIWRTEV